MYNPFYERAVSAVNVSVISPREVVSGYIDGAQQRGRPPQRKHAQTCSSMSDPMGLCCMQRVRSLTGAHSFESSLLPIWQCQRCWS
jgi:hypothetical protein